MTATRPRIDRRREHGAEHRISRRADRGISAAPKPADPTPTTYHPIPPVPRSVDLSGESYGLLTPIHPIGQHPRSRAVWWRCRCVCGATVTYPAGQLRHGTSARSCGCWHGSRMYSEAEQAQSEYSTWRGMLQRTSDPGHESWAYYGAAGVRVCDRWRHDYRAFRQDVGPRPAPGWTLDRIDRDGDYTPSNVRWVPPVVQARNRRNTITATIDGVTRPIAEWAEISGIRRKTIRERLLRGWPPSRLLAAPDPAYVRPITRRPR